MKPPIFAHSRNIIEERVRTLSKFLQKYRVGYIASSVLLGLRPAAVLDEWEEPRLIGKRGKTARLKRLLKELQNTHGLRFHAFWDRGSVLLLDAVLVRKVVRYYSRFKWRQYPFFTNKDIRAVQTDAGLRIWEPTIKRGQIGLILGYGLGNVRGFLDERHRTEKNVITWGDYDLAMTRNLNAFYAHYLHKANVKKQGKY